MLEKLINLFVVKPHLLIIALSQTGLNLIISNEI